MHKILKFDLQEVRSELQKKDYIQSSDPLGPTEDIFRTKEHGYRRIDDSAVLHIMNFEACQSYRLETARRGLICIQVTVNGSYTRLVGDRIELVNPALIQITNSPLSVVDAQAGMKLRGVMLACERQYLVDTFGLNVDRVPAAYRPIFTTDVGLADVLRMPNSPSTISIADQLISCRFPEPLKSTYLKAKAVEMICDIVSQINLLPTLGATRIRASQNKAEAIESAASIYRREIYRPPTVEQLAARVGLNRNDLTAGFRDLFGVTPHHYGIMVRMEQARSLLLEGNLSISEIARRVGFEGYSSFSRAYQAHYGHGPSSVAVREPG